MFVVALSAILRSSLRSVFVRTPFTEDCDDNLLKSWPMRALCLAIAFATALVAIPRTDALAEGAERVALLSLEIAGDAPPELRKQVQVAIAKGLETGGPVIGLEDARRGLAGEPELIGCFSSDCLERIGDRIAASRFVRAVLTASGAHYELELQLLQVGGEERLVNSVTTSCAVCTIADLNERSRDAAEKLLVVDATRFTAVTIASIPHGAIVSIDGLEAGSSPVETELEPGQHRVSARKEGYANTAKTIVVLAGTKDAQRFELPMVASVGASTTQARDYGYLKWGTVAASGTLLILGTTLVVLDDNPACDSSTQQCKFVRQTMLGGVLSIAGSVAAGAAAGWMFWSESNSGRNERATLSIVPGGASAGMAFDF